MLEKIGHYSLTHPASVYDEEALTALELCARTAGKVNEAVEAFNELESDTNSHLEAQDKRIPEVVGETVQNHIESGTFETQIDSFLGNLKARLENLLGSVKTGSTTLDAEIIDSRTGIAGEAYQNLGDALRAQVGTILGSPVDLSNFTEDAYVSQTGAVKSGSSGTGFRHSEPIRIEKTDFYLLGASKVYSSCDIVTFFSHTILNRFHYIGGWTPTKGGKLERVEIPSGAEYMVVNYGSALWGTISLFQSGADRDRMEKTSVSSIMSRLIMHDSEAEPLKVKLIGDSITHGYGGTGYTNDAEHGELIMNGYYVNTDGYCWANLFRDYLESKFNCTVKNFGTTGRDADNLVTYFDNLVQDDDIVICSIGTNDRPDKASSAWGGTKTNETIYRSLNSIYAQCKAKGIDIIFVSPIPCSVSQEEGKPRHAEDIDHIIRKLSEACHMEYVSMYNLFTEYCEATGTDIDTLLKDGLHPNDDGYLVMFHLITKALGLSTKRTGATW